MKKIVVLGSTGSIGKNTLEVVRKSNGQLNVVGLSAFQNENELKAQAREFKVAKFVLTSKEDSEKELIDLVTDPEVDAVVVAIVGFAALRPTLAALRAGKTVALANKETLVTCGQLLTQEAANSKALIIPVDSEHNALFQALQGHPVRNVEKLWITGSGGPFRGKTMADLEKVSVEMALNHPKWKMGPKITIDSASLMNKGLEFIEARWIFGLDVTKIDVLIHPQSLVHGIVEFIDGTMLAHLGETDMKAAISYSLYYPERQKNAVRPLRLDQIRKLEFEAVDYKTFPCVDLAKQALTKGGLAPTVLNAANEVAVDAFLKEKIGFLKIPELISETMNAAPQQALDFEAVFEADTWARQKAKEKIISLST